MPKLKMIGSVALGLALSISLQACAHRADSARPSTAVAVKVEDPPPAELLVCPHDPEGFPEDAAAVMPPAVRSAIMRLAKAYASSANQLARLIDWTAPGACKSVP